MTTEAGNRKREKDLRVAGIVLLAAGIFEILLSVATGFLAIAVVGTVLTIVGAACWSGRHTVPQPNP
jgi:uncharacterized membrane protein HdeD (DUF308 family)